MGDIPAAVISRSKVRDRGAIASWGGGGRQRHSCCCDQ